MSVVSVHFRFDSCFVYLTTCLFSTLFVCLFVGQQEDDSGPSFSSTQSDPPLSPISFISSGKMDDMYPIVHAKVSQTKSGEPTAGTHLLASDPGSVFVDSHRDHVSYKPQIATPGEGAKDTEDEQGDMSASDEEDVCPGMLDGLLGDLLSGVEVDSSDSPLRPTLHSAGDPLWPKTLETTSALDKDLLGRGRGGDSPLLELLQGDIVTSDMADACLSEFTVETGLIGGYLPQLAAASSAPLCDT